MEPKIEERVEAEEREIAILMQQLASAPRGKPPRLAEPEMLWIKAQLLKRWEAERTVQMPLDLVEPFEVALGLAAAGLMFVWAVPSLLSLLPGLSL